VGAFKPSKHLYNQKFDDIISPADSTKSRKSKLAVMSENNGIRPAHVLLNDHKQYRLAAAPSRSEDSEFCVEQDDQLKKYNYGPEDFVDTDMIPDFIDLRHLLNNGAHRLLQIDERKKMNILEDDCPRHFAAASSKNAREERQDDLIKRWQQNLAKMLGKEKGNSCSSSAFDDFTSRTKKGKRKKQQSSSTSNSSSSRTSTSSSTAVVDLKSKKTSNKNKSEKMIIPTRRCDDGLIACPRFKKLELIESEPTFEESSVHSLGEGNKLNPLKEKKYCPWNDLSPGDRNLKTRSSIVNPNNRMNHSNNHNFNRPKKSSSGRRNHADRNQLIHPQQKYLETLSESQLLQLVRGKFNQESGEEDDYPIGGGLSEFSTSLTSSEISVSNSSSSFTTSIATEVDKRIIANKKKQQRNKRNKDLSFSSSTSSSSNFGAYKWPKATMDVDSLQNILKSRNMRMGPKVYTTDVKENSAYISEYTYKEEWSVIRDE